MPRADEGRNGMPGSSWGRSTERFGSTTQGYNPPSRGLSQYLQGRLQRNKKRRTLADFPLVIRSSSSSLAILRQLRILLRSLQERFVLSQARTSGPGPPAVPLHLRPLFAASLLQSSIPRQRRSRNRTFLQRG